MNKEAVINQNGKEKAIILLSGGLDSCVTLAIAKDMGYEVYPVHINYNHLTMKRELTAYNDICNFYNIDENKRLIVDISYLSDIGGSALTDRNIKLETNSVPQSTDKLPSSYVPFRNANMISIAVSYAEVIKASKVFIGAVDEDSSGYPDCRKIFFERFNSLLEIALGDNYQVEILTPIIDNNKSEIVKLGMKLSAPLNLTWSCYQGEEESCGVCESCFLRLQGFSRAGETDPIKYAQK